MASKDDLQAVLKSKYGINKNISQPLEREDCERLLELLDREAGAVKLVESFAQKNSALSGNNRSQGSRRELAERKFRSLETEYRELESAIQQLESSKLTLENRKQQLEQEKERLESEIQDLSSKNLSLTTKVDDLAATNDELLEANDQLKKDNKSLKNVVDAIRLRLARDTNELLKYEDNELRKALIRMFKWTLG
jgi:chromosome segregation ATPase